MSEDVTTPEVETPAAGTEQDQDNASALISAIAKLQIVINSAIKHGVRSLEHAHTAVDMLERLSNLESLVGRQSVQDPEAILQLLPKHLRDIVLADEVKRIQAGTSTLSSNERTLITRLFGVYTARKLVSLATDTAPEDSDTVVEETPEGGA